VARSDKGGTSVVTYRTPDGELVTVLAVVEGGYWRISARQGGPMATGGDGRGSRAAVVRGARPERQS